MKYLIIILAIAGLIYTFRTEESRKSFMAKFTSQKKVIEKNKSKAYEIIPPLQSNGSIRTFRLTTNTVDVNADWWKSLPKEEKESKALLMAVYVASENKADKLELKVFNGDMQLGTYNFYDNYKDYIPVDFDKFNK